MSADELHMFDPGTRKVTMADMNRRELPLPSVGQLIDAVTGAPLDWKDIRKASARVPTPSVSSPPEPQAVSVARESAPLEETRPPSAAAPAVAAVNGKSKRTFVTIRMRGDFGCFSAYAHDIVICPTHVLLLYNSHGGDECPRFEPPIDRPFTLEALKEDGRYTGVPVVHLGLTTEVPGVGWIVVFVRDVASNGEEQ